MVVGRVDIFLGEPKGFQQVECWIVQLFRWDTKDLGAEFFAQRPLVEHKADVEGLRQRRVNLGQFVRAKAVAHKRGVVDARRVADGAVTDGIGDDLFDLGRAVAQLFKAAGTDWLMILKYPPPASFLNFTSAKSGSIPVVSQSITRPMVPVGAITETCALR